jgi:2-polyprenyl-6-methoxyphenol hydroxylase-like FAD-dependent oxidoreductase
MSQSPPDVLICGAGPAGLTLAIDLARRGISFRLIDKLDNPFHGSRGKGLQPRTLEVFEDLGLVDRLAALGAPYPPQREYHSDGTFTDTNTIEHRDPTPAEPYSQPLMVPQFLTEQALRERLAELGHSAEFGCELTALEQDEDGVTVHLSRHGIDNQNGADETLRVPYLVAADGGRSFVRQALNIGFPGKTLGVRGMVADVILTGLPRDLWHRFNEGSMEEQLSICPLAGTNLFQLQAPVPLDGEIDLSVTGLTRMVAHRTHRDDIAVHSVSWASAFHMNARLADHYRAGRVLLVGDAAHTHPPTGGQGLNTSVQDSYNLGWKLSAVIQGAPDSLLDTYEAERRPIAADMLGLSTRLLDAHKRGDTRRGREVQQLDLAYPDSPLTLQNPARSQSLLAGDRAPDAPINTAAGRSTRLFELFKGPHWTLLGYQADRNRIPPHSGLHIHTFGAGLPSAPLSSLLLGDLIDQHGHFQAAYDIAPGDWVLVRPDGYVGARVSSGEIDTLEKYLHSVGLKAQGKADV